MNITLRQGAKTFQLGTFPDSDASATYRDASSAERFLRGFKKDPGAMTHLRRLASDLSGSQFTRGGDDRALRIVAQAIVSGRIKFADDAERRMTYGPQEQPEEAAAPAPSKGASSSAAPKSEPSMFDANFDAAAQAAVLKKAAESGAPFCEECEKKKREREAA